MYTHNFQSTNSNYRQVSIYAISLHNFALMQLEILHHFLNLHNCVQFNTVWHRRYIMMFGLMQFGTLDPWLHFSCVTG